MKEMPSSQIGWDGAAEDAGEGRAREASREEFVDAEGGGGGLEGVGVEGHELDKAGLAVGQLQ